MKYPTASLESWLIVCKEQKEDRQHYDGCKEMEKLRKLIAEKAGRQGEYFSREEWGLETEMEEETMIMIATARWIFHCERCKIDMGKRRRMDMSEKETRETNGDSRLEKSYRDDVSKVQEVRSPVKQQYK